jgi:glycosyltransferase involved in cell wall biosynthesis
MDYVGEMLIETLRHEHASAISVSALRPWAPRLFSHAPRPARWLRQSAERFVARCIIYPAVTGWVRNDFDAFHIVDHSYGHVAHTLPQRRTGIYCHDIDALRPLISNSSAWPLHHRALAWSLMRALQRASVVFYNTTHVREQLIGLGVLDDSKLIHAPLGVASEFTASGPLDATVERGLPQGRFLLHVGSEAPRKRLDLLFRAFALAREKERDLFLVQQGAKLSSDHYSLLDSLGIRRAVIQFPKLPRGGLAHLYRQAALVILPSEREGFGLPVIEALACGTRVLASAIPAFREVGGEATSYCEETEPSSWAATILGLLQLEDSLATRASRLQQATLFSWSRHAETILRAYRGLT